MKTGGRRRLLRRPRLRAAEAPRSPVRGAHLRDHPAAGGRETERAEREAGEGTGGRGVREGGELAGVIMEFNPLF